MTILLNHRAGGGRAAMRWQALRDFVAERAGGRTDIMTTEGVPIARAVSLALDRGERRFVAAGGDGTVNALLNALMAHRDEPGFTGVALGAIGLGSSNDFHKRANGTCPSPPLRIDFDLARPQDVGCIEASSPRGTIRRYFLVNASIGVTAEGNEIFNAPGGPIAVLKRLATGIAIPAAASLAIARHRNIDASVAIDGGPGRPAALSNLAILRNPNISGPLRLPAGDGADDGRLGLWMEEGLARPALFGLLLSLASGRFRPGPSTTLRRCSSVRVRAIRPFPVEFDGEVVRSKDVGFTVLEKAIGVCP